MVLSAHARRSVRELTRRRARSALTVVTIGVAIAGIWLFAIPSVVDARLTAQVEADAMHTVRLAPTAADLDDAQLAALRAVPNVGALDVRTLARTEMRTGDRTQRVILVGVADFADQSVNIVSIDGGGSPVAPGQLLSDVENRRSGRYRGVAGDTVELRTGAGAWISFDVVGSGRTLRYSSEVPGDSPVLYLPDGDVQRVMDYPAPNSIDVLAVDPSPEAVATMVAELRALLADELPDVEYWDVLEVWPEGTWPGSEDFDNFDVVFDVIAAIALVSALILIATTMNSVVREQTREIGIMKAVGGTPRTIALGFLRTAVLLGALGTLLGVAIGIPLSNGVMAFMSREFQGTDVGWQISGLALGLSLAVGLGGTVLASWPALHRAARVTVREAVEDHGVVASYGVGPLDRLVSRLPLPSRTSRMGLRNATRRAGRTVATAVPVALAVGTMLGFGSVLITALAEDTRSFDLEGGDITVWNDGGRGLDEEVGALMEVVPGVELAHPMVYSSVELGGERWVWGLSALSTYDADVVEGRWFTEAEAEAHEQVVVVGRALANTEGLDVGDVVRVETRRGPIDLDVVGIDGHLVNDGQGMFAPYGTVLDYEGWTAGNWWVRTVDGDPATVDAAAEGIHRVLAAEGYRVGSNLRYVAGEENSAEQRLIVSVVMALGVPVVAIGMVGLASAMTSNIVDRTREIGVLRSIGARRRDLRAVFRAESLTIALLGWLLGIPTGYAVARLVLWVLEQEFDAPFELAFPAWPIGVSLLVTLAATALVMHLPLRRVMRMRPGAALRYE